MLAVASQNPLRHRNPLLTPYPLARLYVLQCQRPDWANALAVRIYSSNLEALESLSSPTAPSVKQNSPRAEYPLHQAMQGRLGSQA